MYTSDFDYNLPVELIANRPAEPRESARLMRILKKLKKISHHQIGDFPDFLRAGDLLVVNNSKVFKARLEARLFTPDFQPLRAESKPTEVFLVRAMENFGVWQALARPGRHLSVGMRLVFAPGFSAEVMLRKDDGTFLIDFNLDEETVINRANTYGSVPLPPYIKDETHELEIYQTVYAKPDKVGSVAAPTAGFHLTENLLEKIKNKGVNLVEVTLHVGLGTFLPVKSERIDDHVMHSERVEISASVAKIINDTKANGGRVIAVGTTALRTLEGVAGVSGGRVSAYQGEVDIFIKPGFDFLVVDALLTNFHLPKSTLLMLVAAFIGQRDFALEAYAEAVKDRYRFFSFGDAMFIE